MPTLPAQWPTCSGPVGRKPVSTRALRSGAEVGWSMADDSAAPAPGRGATAGRDRPASNWQNESVSEFTIAISGPANRNSTMSTINGRYWSALR